MVLSMTGYSRAEGIYDGINYSIEIKSLNSKGFDCKIRLPNALNSLEMSLHKTLTMLKRGKVDVFISVDPIGTDTNGFLNKDKLESYIKELQKISPDSTKTELLGFSLRLPDVFSTNEKYSLDDGLSSFISDLLNQSIEEHLLFRKQEGEALKKALVIANDKIINYLVLISELEDERKDKLRKKLLTALEQKSLEIDFNRYEQEVIYYIEKLDISEEKVRLKNHCIYFEEQLQLDVPIGKKLGFIAQEMGREINTIGSKASHEGMQKLVIGMKEELEVIKEQALNVL